MKRDKLKLMWMEIHENDQAKNRENVRKTIQMKHGKVIAKMLNEQKMKAIVYSISFFLFLGIMVYAFLYLKINFLITSLIPLTLTGFFLFLKTTSEINKYKILSSTEDKMSIKDSILFFQKKIERIEKMNFVFNICLFYIMAIGISVVVMNDRGAIYIFNKSGMTPFLVVFILILLSVPWLIRRLYRQKYKKIYSFLKNNLNDE